MFVRRITLLGATMAVLVATPALAQKQYGPGVSDTEIKIGQTIAYSGPASAYGTLGKVEAAYFKWLNETKGGINGRKITFISRDDAYSPPKAVENVRSLVEGDDLDRRALLRPILRPRALRVHPWPRLDSHADGRLGERADDQRDDHPLRGGRRTQRDAATPARDPAQPAVAARAHRRAGPHVAQRASLHRASGLDC
jgi:hypothetical protein